MNEPLYRRVRHMSWRFGTRNAEYCFYAIRQHGTTGPIKLGRAVDPRARLCEFQVGCPVELELMCYVPEWCVTERQAHAQWAALRLRGEWFAATDELLTWLHTLPGRAAALLPYRQRVLAIEQGQSGIGRPLVELVRAERRARRASKVRRAA